MDSNSSMGKKMEEKEVKNVQLISNQACKPPKFRAIPEIVYKGDPNGALSQIPPNVLMINDVRDSYTYKINEIGNFELREACDRLYENGELKDKFKITKTKGLTHALGFPQVFKSEWIIIILSRIHDGQIC